MVEANTILQSNCPLMTVFCSMSQYCTIIPIIIIQKKKLEFTKYLDPQQHVTVDYEISLPATSYHFASTTHCLSCAS